MNNYNSFAVLRSARHRLSARALLLSASVAALVGASPQAARAAIEGSLVGWGDSSDGRTNVPIGDGFVAIAGGADHSLALRSDGSLAGWGYNSFGQVNVPTGSDFVAIAAGGAHSLALKSDGSLVGWGFGAYGMANMPTGNDFAAIAAGGYHNLALKSDGSLVGWGRNDAGQSTVPTGNDFTAIAAGKYHSLALRSDGSLVTWGASGSGVETVPTGNDFTAIAAAGNHSLALRSDGSLVGWGVGGSSVPTGNDFVAIAAGTQHSLALKSDGSLVAWGRSLEGQTIVPAGNDFIAIAGGNYHSLAIRAPSGASDQVPIPISLTPVGVSVLGGTTGSSPGGLDAVFEDTVETAGDFQASYDTVGSPEFASSYSGTSGFDLGNFVTTGPDGYFQVWDLDFTGTLADGGQVTLQFKYNDAGMDEFEEGFLVIWHYGEYGSAGERQWKWLRDSIDTVNNIITITTDNFSPYTLGFQDAASVVPEPWSFLVWGGLATVAAILRRRGACGP